MRSRKNVVTIRMNDAEYEMLKTRVKESGLTQQSFIINAIKGSVIASADEIDILMDLSRTLADLVRQLRGLSTNVNQIAHVANGFKVIPTIHELLQIHDEITRFRKESEKIWQSIRSSINQQKLTGP